MGAARDHPPDPPTNGPADRRPRVMADASLLGAVALGVFVVWHVLRYAAAGFGRAPLADPDPDGGSALLLSALLVWLPLGVHTAVGLRQSARWALQPRDGGERTRILHHLAGGITLLFLIYHVVTARLPLLTGERVRAELPSELYATLSSTTDWGIPAEALLYLVGLLATVFHLSYGVELACLRWGLARSARGVRRLRLACAGAGVALFLVGAATIVHFATGTGPSAY